MAQTYTRRFWKAASPGAGSINVFTTPGDAVYVLRDLVVDNAAAVVNGINVIVHSQGKQYWLARLALEPFTTLRTDLRQVLEEGDIVEVSGLGGGWTSLATGYRLSTPDA